jgi:SAM-dependent methyltransferase
MYHSHPVKPFWVSAKVCGDLKKGIPLEEALEPSHDHFLGADAVAYGISKTSQLCFSSSVLDLGSGLGGLSVLVQAKYHCHLVVGVEAQQDRVLCAEQINEAAGTSVNVVQDDMLSYLLDQDHRRRFTHVFSFLAILHCPSKGEVLEAIGNVLKDGGSVYIEDYVTRKPTYEEERHALHDVISCPGLLSLSEYIRCLEAGGVSVFEISDMTDKWRDIVVAREADFSAEPPKSPIAKYLTAEELQGARQFSKGVAALFASGAIAGVRISARKMAK